MIKGGPIKLSRRTLFKASAAAAIAIAGGGALLLRGPNGLIDDILKRGIGSFKMHAADRKQLHDATYAYLRSEGAKDLSLRVMGAGYAALNFPYVRHLLPDDGLFKIEQLERQVVTYFLLSTDYLGATDGQADNSYQANLLISYLGFTGVCAIPWAQIA